MTNDQIKHMVQRFIGWHLPKDFSPDGGISFKPSGHLYQPRGTNLFDTAQAEAMVLYMLEGLPEPDPMSAPEFQRPRVPGDDRFDEDVPESADFTGDHLHPSEFSQKER